MTEQQSNSPFADAPWIDPVPATETAAPAPAVLDIAMCERNFEHSAATRHRRDQCPVHVANEAEREGEAEFMRRYPGVL